MAYYDDDFQGYAIGTNLPFGSWIADPGAFIGQIIAGGPSGTDRSFSVFGAAGYINPTYLSTFTQFTALKVDNVGGFGVTSFDFANGPNIFSQTFSLLSIRIELDGTVTALCPASGEIFGNTGDVWFSFYAWNFFQINVTLTDVLVVGVPHVNVECEVALNGVSILSFNVTTGVLSSVLNGGTAAVNRFRLTGGDYDAYTLDTLQPIVSYPHPGSPTCRVNQSVIELEQLPDSAEAQVVQGVIELEQLPDSAQCQIIQGVIELLLGSYGRWYVSES